MAISRLTRQELKTRCPRDYADGDVIHVSKYLIHLKKSARGNSLKSWVETIDGKILDCTPGTRGGWPYYIADFIHA